MRHALILVGLSLGCTPVPETPPATAPTPKAEVDPPRLIDEPQELLAWHWVTRPDDQEFPQVREVHTDDNLRYEFVVDEDERVRITKTGSKGRPEWSHDLPRVSLPGGFLLLHGERLFVAQHSHMSTGATLFALDANTGAELWSTHLVGLGPIGHSKYRNRVQLDARDHAVIVYGHESQGRYVEARDTATGELLGNRKVDDAEAAL